MIFESKQTKTLFLEVVVKAKKRYSFTVENFCIMGNHYHLIVRPAKGESLSRIMQYMMSMFAMAFNRLFGLTGHVWGERFFSRIIKSLREYWAISEYIDDNPVKAGLARFRGQWAFSGLAHRRRGDSTILKR